MKFISQSCPRHLIVVLGNQLDSGSAAFDDFDAKQDAVWMTEVADESTHVWSQKARIALFLASMRHFRDRLRARGLAVHYRQLDDSEDCGSFSEELKAAVRKLGPQRLIVVEPGEWRVKRALEAAANELGLELEMRPDRHFLCSREQFTAHTKGRKQIRLEFFYREMRRRHGVLMDGENPAGGGWNFDTETFDPVGLSGLAYWYALFPVHEVVFRGMLRNLGRAARANPDGAMPLKPVAESPP